MKKILVTGGAGFIGSHLTEALLQRGDHVTVIDDESTGAQVNLADVCRHPLFSWVSGSADDRRTIDALLDDIDEVYHLASAVGVALVASRPIEAIQRILQPNHVVLAALQQRQERLPSRPVRFFLASSSEVYGKNPSESWPEGADLIFGPTHCARWSYGASKAIDEFMALAYWRQYQLPVVIGRFFNVVGPRQRGDYGMVLPRLIDAAKRGGPLTVHDDGHQVRCFAHVRDVVAQVLQLMESPQAVGQVFNMGSDQPISILELARQVADHFTPVPAIQFQAYAEAYDADFEDVRRRVPDLSRLRATIDYRPQYDLPAIIRELVEQGTSTTDTRSTDASE